MEVNKLADLVLWKPENFGAKPEVVIKSGFIAWAQVRLHLNISLSLLAYNTLLDG